MSINSDTALRTIFNARSNTNRDDFYLNERQFPDVASMFTTLDKTEHAHFRRIVSQGFSASSMREMESRVVSHINNFIDIVSKSAASGSQKDFIADKVDGSEWSEPFNMTHWFSYLTYDILGDLCLGRSFDMLRRPEYRFAIDNISQALHYNYIVCSSSSFTVLKA